tara:strand:- start:2896 stop:3081 length:186 start_codon:yes stop_codon:yes gene_type:complete
MQEQMSDIEWELRQLWMAVDYYERAIQNTFFKADVEKFNETIASLKKQIKDLERKRDEQGE